MEPLNMLDHTPLGVRIKCEGVQLTEKHSAQKRNITKSKVKWEKCDLDMYRELIESGLKNDLKIGDTEFDIIWTVTQLNPLSHISRHPHDFSNRRSRRGI